MLLDKRRQEIIKLAELRQGISIKDLADHFKVSTMTILRDIKVLEERSLIESVRGGVLPLDVHKAANNYANYYEYKKRSAMLEKQDIASWCVDNLVQDRMILALEGGSSVASLIRFLNNKKRITVLTNGFFVAQEALSHLNESSKVILSGGLIEKSSYVMVGPDAETFFNDKYIDIAFISCVAFDLNVGPMDSNPLDIQVKKAMIKNAKKRVLLLDTTKFDRRSILPTIALNEVNTIVTNKNIDDDIKKALLSFGIETHFV